MSKTFLPIKKKYTIIMTGNPIKHKLLAQDLELSVHLLNRGLKDKIATLEIQVVRE